MEICRPGTSSGLKCPRCSSTGSMAGGSDCRYSTWRTSSSPAVRFSAGTPSGKHARCCATQEVRAGGTGSRSAPIRTTGTGCCANTTAPVCGSVVAVSERSGSGCSRTPGPTVSSDSLVVHPRSAAWIDLLRAATDAAPTWLVYKNVESALTGTGDIDAVASSHDFPAISTVVLSWAERFQLWPVFVCNHFPAGPNFVAVHVSYTHLPILT